jgi:hypothetical protein
MAEIEDETETGFSHAFQTQSFMAKAHREVL